MSFQPILPASGLVGWKFLERTAEAQGQAFANTPVLQRDTSYFMQNISTIETAEQLVADRKLMRVALGAFGLKDDLNNSFFIKKILSEGTLDPKALANRMSDSRYSDLAEAFGFDLGVPNTKISDFAEKIISRYREQEFEIAIGQKDENMRLALNANRELAEIARNGENERTQWFTIMGNAPLRKVIETALGLPKSFAQIDLDQQLGVLKEKAERQLGLSSPKDLSDPAAREKVVERYLLRAEMNTGPGSSPASIALTLLQSR